MSSDKDRPRPLTVRSFGLSDTGRVRSGNEDQFLVAELAKSMRVRQSSLAQSATQYGDERGYLFLVADGMGGARGGERASALAIGAIENFALNTLKWFFHLESGEAPTVLDEFQNALRQADADIMKEGVRHPELRGMGTTVTLAYAIDGVLFVMHVGDSRCYLERKGVLHLLTHDHTVVAELVRTGQIRADQAATHAYRHVITNVVGGDAIGVRVEVQKIVLEEDDVLLLCSDGLTEMLSDEQIEPALTLARRDPESACGQLVRVANENGGRDNITVVVAHFAGDQISTK